MRNRSHLDLVWSNPDDPGSGTRTGEPAGVPTLAHQWQASSGRRRLVRLDTVRLPERPELLYVRLYTSDGLIGLGEAFGQADQTERYLHEVAAPRLLRAPCERVVEVARTLVPAARASGSTGDRRGASAIDLALWDIVGRAAGRPLHELLGGACRERIRLYNSFPRTTTTRRPEDLDDVANRLADQRITAMKVRPFPSNQPRSGSTRVDNALLDKALRPLRRIRDRFGPDMDLMLELESRWDLPTAKRIARAAEEVDPFWLEEPIRADDIRTIAAYARSARVPMTLREPLVDRYPLSDLIGRRIAGIVLFSLGWSGGLSEAVPVASLADSHHLPLTLYGRAGPVLLAASTQLAVSAPNALIQETVQEYYNDWYADVVTCLPEVRAGGIAPPSGPGLGTDIHPDLPRRPGAVLRTTEG